MPYLRKVNHASEAGIISSLLAEIKSTIPFHFHVDNTIPCFTPSGEIRRINYILFNCNFVVLLERSMHGKRRDPSCRKDVGKQPEDIGNRDGCNGHMGHVNKRLTLLSTTWMIAKTSLRRIRTSLIGKNETKTRRRKHDGSYFVMGVSSPRKRGSTIQIGSILTFVDRQQTTSDVAFGRLQKRETPKCVDEITSLSSHNIKA